jgi:DNA-binding GntR family transcriptional regulator
MIHLQPIKLLPARERVASAMRKAIIAQDLVEGAQITLDSIAGLLGVSRTPVREAFQMLENEGLIKLSPNKGAVILGITPRTVREHFQIRAALESEASAIVCQVKADLTDIRDIIEQSEEAIANQEFEEYSNLNQAFHVAIWTASDNFRMKSILSVMWNGLSMRYMETLEEYAVKSFSEHKELLRMFEEGDGEGARTMMHQHIDRSMQDMLTNLKNRD